jgi:multiple sugar transport system ATP-binding protein
VAGFGRANIRQAVLGARPEDIHVVAPGAETANLTAPIYSVELTGESTFVSVHAGDRLLTMRADKNFTGTFDQPIGVNIPTERAFLFDRESQNRVDV